MCVCVCVCVDLYAKHCARCGIFLSLIFLIICCGMRWIFMTFTAKQDLMEVCFMLFKGMPSPSCVCRFKYPGRHLQHLCTAKSILKASSHAVWPVDLWQVLQEHQGMDQQTGPQAHKSEKHLMTLQALFRWSMALGLKREVNYVIEWILCNCITRLNINFHFKTNTHLKLALTLPATCTEHQIEPLVCNMMT